jgi:hypothetical protein
MQPSKWDLVLEARPIPLVDHLMSEVARLFARDLARWPPEVEAFDAPTGASLRALLEGAPARPHPQLYREAFALTRLDLSREFEALDDYWRNQRWLSAGLAASERSMLQFLSRFMAEQLLALGEATQGRLTRARLLEVLDRTRAAFFAGMNS